MERQQAIKRVTLIGAALDAALALAKVFGGIVFHSAALIADGVHSASDIVTDVFVLLVNKHASASPDTDHPYGHARFETIGTAALGLVLVVVAGGLAWEIVLSFFEQSASALSPLALIIAAISVASKEWIFHYTMRVAKQTDSSLLAANAWHSRSDALSSIVVFVGLTGSLFGATWLEPAAAVVVALMIGRMGIGLVVDALQELADKGLDKEQYHDIEKAIESVPGIVSAHNMRSRLHSGKAFLDVHIQVDSKISVSEGHLIGDHACQAIRQHLPEVRDITVHIDSEDDTHHSQQLNLPLRPQIEQTLASYPELTDWQQVQIHYLNGKVDVELHYQGDDQDKERMEVSAKDAIAQQPWLRAINIWFSA